MYAEVDSENTTKVWQEVPCDLHDALRAGLVDLARANREVEICGFILDDGTLVNITNVDENPERGFTMDPDQMMRVVKGKNGIEATYHSHPSGRKWPSENDSEQMTFLYRQGCPWRYLIVTTEDVFEFQHRDRSV